MLISLRITLLDGFFIDQSRSILISSLPYVISVPINDFNNPS